MGRIRKKRMKRNDGKTREGRGNIRNEKEGREDMGRIREKRG